MKNKLSERLKIIIGSSISVFICFLSLPLWALQISDYEPLTSQTGRIEITQLDSAEYLDIVVEISGTEVTYTLEQVNENLVRLFIDDERLKKDEVFIKASISSPSGSLTRLFSHKANNTSAFTIKGAAEAQEVRQAVAEEPKKKVLIHANNIRDNNKDNTADFVDGVLQIKITAGINTVGYAVNLLAKANNLNVLILDGDSAVHAAPLVSDVTDFSDLYMASNKAVAHILIDEEKRLVRVVASNAFYDSDNPVALRHDESVPLITVFNQVASSINYKPLVLDGDQVFLNTLVNGLNVKTLDELALLVGENGGFLVIDDSNKLMRVRN